MKKLIIFLALFLLPISVFADEVNTYKLKNGQTVVIKQVSTNPIVTIDTWIKTGSINETDKNNGVAHFLEHLFFKGSSKYKAGEFDRLIESKGGVTNAATSKDFTHYYITIPSSEFETALDLHADMLLSPQIPSDELEKERKVVLEEIAKDLNTPRNKVSKNLTKMMFKTHPYKREVIGTKDVIENISRDEILDFYKSFYFPKNMTTVIVGDIELKATLNAVEKAFSVNKNKGVNPKFKFEKPLTKNVEMIENADVSTGYMAIGYNTVPFKNSDTYALDVLAIILGQGRSSRFYQEIKDKKQLAYSITAGNASSRDAGMFVINANFQPEKIEKLKKSINDEIVKIQKYGITDEDLEFAKNVVEKDILFSRESISDISSEIGYAFTVTDGIDVYDKYLANIKKVQKEDVRYVANKYLKYHATSILLPNECEKQISNIKIFKDTEAKFVKDFAGIQKYTLENGATLLVNKHDANEIVAISIYAKGGGFVENIAGTGFLTAQVMTKGTKKYSMEELSKIMEENGINIVPSSGGDGFVVNVLTTKNQLPKMFELLDEVINNATLEEEKINKDKDSLMNSIKKSRDIPLNIALEGYKTNIFKGSPYSNTHTVLEKTVPMIKRSDIVNFYDKIFYPQNVVISVNGDVDTKQMVGHFTNIFNGKKGTKFEYKNYKNRVKPIQHQEVMTKKIADLQTSWYISGWQVSGNTNKKEYATLQVINSILGSGMSSRLFKNVRDTEGLAYQIGSGYSPNVLGGSFLVYIGTNPKTLKYSEKRLNEEVERLKKEFVSEAELKGAKDKLIGNYLIGLETNLEKAVTVCNFETSGRGFEFIEEYRTYINAVTASDIISVANKYFNNNKVTSIVDVK